MENMEKQIRQRREQDDVSYFEKPKRKTKEEASKTEVNVCSFPLGTLGPLW